VSGESKKANSVLYSTVPVIIMYKVPSCALKRVASFTRNQVQIFNMSSSTGESILLDKKHERASASARASAVIRTAHADIDDLSRSNVNTPKESAEPKNNLKRSNHNQKRTSIRGRGKGKGNINTTGVRANNRNHKGQGQNDTSRNDGRSNKHVEILTDFSRLVQESQAARYKVHKPKCSCSKVRALALTTRTKRNENENRKDERQNFETSDGFVILPDIKTIQSIFTGGSATAESYLLDPLGCEKTLQEIIFSPKTTDNNQTQIKVKVKVSSASCILHNEANGFLCITSPSRTIVDGAQICAREAQQLKADKGIALHPDHADYICTLRQSILKSLLAGKKSNGNGNPSSESMNMLLQELRDQGVDVSNDANSIHKPMIVIGHHLKTMLNMNITKGKDNFMFTMITKTIKKERCVFEIDLPGGKRHLGETSFECAVRETEEETSLLIDETWMIGDGKPVRSRDQSERGNVFFLARPPQKDILEDIGKNVFWTKHSLDL
jgi:hypothetical protein